MNIIENKKKITIIGRGTAGALTAAHFSYYTDFEIDWYYDPNISTQSVGEASTINTPRLLRESINISYRDLDKLNCTTKRGIRKLDWGNSNKDFIHDFDPFLSAIHFNAIDLQKFIVNKLRNRINIIETQSPTFSKIDSTQIISCKGKPKDYSSYYKSTSSPVNAAYVVPISWDFPKYDYSFHIARPYGWCFGIPLKNRMSIGYLYNSNINTKEDIKEDIQNVFQKLNLYPDDNHTGFTEWSFNNYFKKQNFTERVSYNGNSSFFLDPLESTSHSFSNSINRKIFDYLYRRSSLEKINKDYLKSAMEIQRIGALHYFAGSSFKTDFWDYAKEIGGNFIKNNIKDYEFKKMYKFCRDFSYSKNITYPLGAELVDKEIGGWPARSYTQNFEGLGLYPKLDKLLNI